MFPFFELIVGFCAFIYVLETYLDFRQHQRFKVTTLPTELANIVDQEKFVKSQQYGLAKSNFGFVHSAFSVTETLFILLAGGIPWLWQVSARPLEWIGLSVENDICHAIVFVILAKAIEIPFEIPFSLYSTFVIEERFGFNKQTISLFFTDMAKSLALSLVIGIPILSALLYLITWGGPYFYIYVWLFMVVITFFLLTIYPNFIAPLFNKFTPLEEGELRTAIYDLAQKLGFPLTKLFVVDGSTRSAHSNAYFFGFFKNKRIVLYDTLLKQVDTEGTLAILAHELGHWALSHNVWNLVISQVHLFIFFFLFGQMINSVEMYRSFGFDTEPE